MKMQNLRRTDSLTKKHISKLHERIQLKYEEMQKKLEKSRSIDTLTNLNDDYVFQNEKKFVSVSDLSKVDDVYNGVNINQSNAHHETFILRHKHKDASYEEIVYNEAVITEAESISNLYERIEKEYENNEESVFFTKDIFKTSLESLNENSKESDESSEPYTPPPRSIRDRIESRLKKRQIESLEKKSKNKKRRSSNEKLEKLILSNISTSRNLKVYKKNKIATVTVAIIEVTGLEQTLDDRRVLLFRLRLGSEKRKSKIVKSNNNEVKFQELFNIPLYDDDDNTLEVTLWDKDNLMGRTIIDLLTFDKEMTHKINVNLDGEINVFYLLTISGTLTNTVYDVDESEIRKREYSMKRKYAWYRIYDNLKNIGVLNIIIYGAKGLSGQDCYCVVHLNNQRIQTQTDYKTYDPSWMKIVSITITDVTSILDVIVYDEKKTEEIGKIAIPLLNIRAGKKWYALKDCTLKERAKGNKPRILLEMNVIWNLVKAAVRVINPKETNYLVTEEKLDRHVFAKHLARAKIVFSWLIEAFKTMKSCFEWESTRSNIIALFVWIFFCIYVQIWMLPLLLLIPFVWYKPDKKIKDSLQLEPKSEKDEKNATLRQKLSSLQEIILSIQNIIGTLASTGESIKNLFNFTVPFVSFLAIFFIILITFFMYMIPFNYICILWGIHKFTRKLIKPNRIPNNEILDLISRVPDDETLMECEEISLGDISEDNE